VVGAQKDIRYYGTTVTGVLNSPETTGMSFWSINPYIGCAFGCTYCYARYAHRFVMERRTADGGRETGESLSHVPSLDDELEELPPWLAFERRIFVKRNAAQALRRTLQGRSKSLGAVQRGEPIVIGTATDPYQPAERHFRITRELLEVLAEARRLRLVIITKSPLITRDVALLARIAQRSRLTIHLSLITLDRELARRVEPRAPTPESRLRALRRLSAAGIDVGINLMPVLPGITDRPDPLAALVRAVAEGGASHINACALRLRVTSRRRYLPWLDQEFPELTARYQRAYGRNYQITDRYREGLRQFLKRACRKAGIRYGSSYDTPADGGTSPVRDNPPCPPANTRTLPIVTEEVRDADGNTDAPPHADPQFALGL
jgi:DNA repair photolyase